MEEEEEEEEEEEKNGMRVRQWKKKRKGKNMRKLGEVRKGREEGLTGLLLFVLPLCCVLFPPFLVAGMDFWYIRISTPAVTTVLLYLVG